MENVLKGLPDKIRDQLSRHHTQMHFKSNEMYTFLNHFQIARSWR
jgi:cation transport regulator ChaB